MHSILQFDSSDSSIRPRGLWRKCFLRVHPSCSMCTWGCGPHEFNCATTTASVKSTVPGPRLRGRFFFRKLMCICTVESTKIHYFLRRMSRSTRGLRVTPTGRRIHMYAKATRSRESTLGSVSLGPPPRRTYHHHHRR